MPKSNTWRRLCCTCAHADDVEYQSPFEESPRRQGPRSRVKSGKKTWTRRSLLENEQADDYSTNHVPIELMAYQMRAIETPTNIPRTKDDDDYDVRQRLTNTSTHRQRRTVQNMFDKLPRTESDSKTTFPWMDEGFVPTSRSGTRLGVRSVQMNAKRVELLNAGGNLGRSNTDVDIRSPHAFQPYVKSQSFTEGQVMNPATSYYQTSKYTPHEMNYNYHNKHLKTVPYENNAPNNVSMIPRPAIPRSAVPRAPPPLSGRFAQYDNHPMVLKPSKTNVGVRRISNSHGQRGPDNPIPKLKDYPGIKSSLVCHVEAPTSVKPRTTAMDIFPHVTDLEGDASDENEDSSFVSDFTLKKSPSDVDSDVSLQRNPQPGLFSDQSNKYQRLKAHSTKGGKGNTKSNKKDKNRAESMYGYIPKAVQNVYASTVLEGTQIDDFFKTKNRRKHRPTSRNSVSEDASFIMLSSESENEPESVIITTVLEGDEETQMENEHQLVNENEPENAHKFENKIESGNEFEYALKNTNARVAIFDHKYTHKALEHDIDQVFMNLNLQKASNIRTDKRNIDMTNGSSRNKVLESCNQKQERRRKTQGERSQKNKQNRQSESDNNSIEMHQDAKEVEKACAEPSSTDVNENKLIMIDFPPNIETDKLSDLSSNTRKQLIQTSSGSDVTVKSGSSAKSVLKYTEFLY